MKEKRKGRWDEYTVDNIISIVKQRTIELNKTPIRTDFGTKSNTPSANYIINKLELSSWNDVLQFCGVGYAKEKYTDEKILVTLKNTIESLGYTPNFNQYKSKRYKPSANCIVAHFGTYENALQKIGFTSIVTNEDLLDILRGFYNKNGSSPTTNDMKHKNNLPGSEKYYGRFKTTSWNEILELAGLPLNHINKHDKKFALNQLKDFTKQLNRIPTAEDFKKNNWKPFHGYYNRYFGSYDNACYLAGLIDKPLTEEERIKISVNELIKLADNLKRCPTVFEYEQLTHRGYVRRELERSLKTKYNNICKMYLPYKLNIDNDILKEDIFKEMKSILDKNKKALTFNEMKRQGLSYFHTVFESKCNMTFNQIITYLGYEPIGSTTAIRTEDKMLDDFHKLFKILGRIPYTNELCISNDIATYGTYVRYFNSIKNVCDILNIDYDLHYKNNAAGKICFDNNGGLCRSFVERDITNYFISLGLRYDKEVYYSEIISYMGYKRMDWRLYDGDEIYYIEYFGLYNRGSKKKIIKEYNEKTKYKIKKLYQHGYIDNCIFIFPNDIKTKTFDEIFGFVLNFKKECA